MAMHYPRGLMGRIKASKLRPVGIAIGDDLQWQGGVSQTDQLRLLALMQEFQQKYPVEQLQEARATAVASTENGVHPNPSTVVPVSSPATTVSQPVPTVTSTPAKPKNK